MLNSAGVDYPCVVYIGDVPVERTFAGSLFLYRLLWNYPRDRLLIVEALRRADVARRLPGAAYATLATIPERLLRTRLHPHVSAASAWLQPHVARLVPLALGSFIPEAVLTVSGELYTWMAAAAFAKRYSLPFHAVIHDTWPRPGGELAWTERLVASRQDDALRQAVSRFCISAQMACTCVNRFGGASVLHPLRAPDAIPWPGPPGRLREPRSRPVGYFIGSIHHSEGVLDLADALASCEGRLVIYGPLHSTDATRLRLTRSNIELRGFTAWAEIERRCRNEADFLFVSVSFNERDRMDDSFPSKLTDYTLLGLPIVVYAPERSAVAGWVRDNPGVAVLVPESGAKYLLPVINRLISDPTWCQNLACTALQVGERDFSHTRVESTFFHALTTERKARVGSSPHRASP